MFVLLLFVYVLCVSCRPTEEERVRLWNEEGNVWPPKWQTETPEFAAHREAREKEIFSQLTFSDERWENMLQFTQSLLVPKFTEVGFELIDTPKDVRDKLKEIVDKGVANWDSLRSEGHVDVIYKDAEYKNPKFVDIGGLAKYTLDALKGIHEEWAGGIELIGTSAYGVRLYQNGSSLAMHHDKVETHVISSIVHIAHEYDDDNEPWPIQIEDHNGKLHSVNLAPGQMLFYESAKCLHGRMKTFKGKYYGSIFLHYKPVDTNIWNFNVEKVIASVPPHWRKNVKYENQRSPRYAGAALTIDSISTEHALKIPRVPKFNKNEEDSFFEEDEEDL